MKILVINCGSSSIKFQLYNTAIMRILSKGIIVKIGEKDSFLEYEVDGVKLRKETIVTDHQVGIKLMLETLLNRRHGVLRDLSEISAVGHRAVHGGREFIESALITEKTIKKMDELIPLAPLHNPVNLVGIMEARRVLPEIPHVAVFDTSFHQTMPPKAYLYALPYEYWEKRHIRKYGFHGTSYRYVSQKAAKILGRSITGLKMIICHLGNGVSVAALDGGKCIDTSMGLSPLEGLMMGTRAGDIDPGVILYLHRQLGSGMDRIDNLLNKESGLLGISGVSNDMITIEKKASEGNKRCQLAIDLFAYRAKKYIGAYAAALGGVDTLVFTAGIGENSRLIREKICNNLEFLGIFLDEKMNRNAISMEQIISTPKSRVTVMVVPTNEEEIIALDTLEIAKEAISSETGRLPCKAVADR